MKNRVGFSLAGILVLLASSGLAQQAPPAGALPAAAKRTDLYLVHFVKAAPGKTSELEESLVNPLPGTPMPTHVLILRHLHGDDWDFAVIQHLGNKVTIDTTGPAAGTAARELRAWHNDSYADGPSWAEFAKAMGIGQPQAGAAPAGKDVYVLSTYRGAPGHRAPLEETLKRVAASGRRPADGVILQHRDGSPWDYVILARYADWKEFAAEQDDPEAEARARKAGLTQDPGHEIRQHMASHHDTIAERIAAKASQ